jgi:acetyl esterase/lipase
MVIADGLRAIRVVREQASRWGIDPDRLGILGFSAGAYVAVGAATKYMDAESRPSFAASVYGEWWDHWIPADAPPLFLAAASNDPLIDVSSNATHYAAWYAAGRRAELHIYGDGGHGFGIEPQGLPSDAWIDQFHGWLVAEGMTPKVLSR